MYYILMGLNVEGVAYKRIALTMCLNCLKVPNPETVNKNLLYMLEELNVGLI